MAIKIGHSSIDENGKIAGGVAGDQTGKEICTRNWYNGGWQAVLRPKSSTLAEKSAKACEAGCSNNRIGYDQNQRNTLNTQAKAVGYDLAKIAVGCECDCSAFMHVCAIAGGANLSYGSNGCTTRTMVAAFVKSGDYEKLTDANYLTSDKYLRRGDILVKEGSHTVMVLQNGSAAGTQVSTPATPTTPTTSNTKEENEVKLSTLKKGDKGAQVKALQAILVGYGGEPAQFIKNAGGVDGDFGSGTEKAVLAYKKAKGLTGGSDVGPTTWSHLLGTA